MYIELEKHELDQIAARKHENVSRETYSYLRVKVRRVQEKGRTNMLFVMRTKASAKTVLITAGPGLTT